MREASGSKNLQKTIMTYVIGLVALIGVSFFCGLLVFRFSRFLTLFLPVSTAIIILFLLFGDHLGLWRLVPRHVIRHLSSIVFVYCIGIFLFSHVCWLLAFCDFNMFSDKSRFPLSQIDWIEVDQRGSVYCLSITYSRLQIFNSEGKFLKGWFVRIPGGVRGACQVSISEDGDIVLGKDGRAHYVYDQFGNRKTPNEEHSRILTAVLSRKTTDIEGNIYELKSPLIRPHIAKLTKNANEFTLTKDPIGLWSHTTPFLFWVFLIFVVLNYFFWRN